MAEQVCGDIAPGWKVRMSCVKTKSHSGNHEDSHGCWWRNYSAPVAEPSLKPEAEQWRCDPYRLIGAIALKKSLAECVEALNVTLNICEDGDTGCDFGRVVRAM